MNWRQFLPSFISINRPEERATSLASSNIPEWLIIALGGGMTESGVTVTAKSALKVPAIMRTVQLLSGAIASMNWDVFERSGETAVKNPAHPVNKLLHKPSPLYNEYNFKHTAQTNLTLYNSVFIEIVRDRNATPIELRIIEPPDITRYGRMEDGSGLVYEVRDDLTKNTRIIQDENMIFLRGLSFDGIEPVSIIEYVKESIGLAIAATEYGASFIGNRANIDGYLSYDKELSDKARKHLSKSWGSYKGKNSGTPVLEYGLQFHPIAVEPEKATLPQIRKFQVEEMSRIFGIPLPYLSAVEDMGFGSLQVLDHHFVKHCLWHIVEIWEAEFNSKLFRNGNFEKYFIRFDLDTILRADIKTRFEAYQIALQSMFMNSNEVRAKENLPPRDGGDIFENPNTTSGKDQSYE